MNNMHPYKVQKLMEDQAGLATSVGDDSRSMDMQEPTEELLPFVKRRSDDDPTFESVTDPNEINELRSKYEHVAAQSGTSVLKLWLNNGVALGLISEEDAATICSSMESNK